MKSIRVCAVLLFSATSSLMMVGSNGTKPGNFKITKLEMCDPKIQYPVMMKTEITSKDGKRYLSGNSDFTIDLGKNADYNVTIGLKKTKDDAEFSPLISFYEEDMCTAIKKYLGDIVDDMEKAAGMEPGKCPIAKGKYSMKDYVFEPSKIGYDSIPEGVLQAVQVVRDKGTKQVLFCTVTEGENFP